MDDDQLTLTRIVRRARHEFAHREVVSRERTGTETTTYGDLLARVDRLAHALRALGVGPGERVATLGWNHRRHLELYLAVTTSGAVLHTVNVRLGPDQVREVIAHAGDVVLFAEDEYAEEHAEWFRSRGGRAVIGFGAPTAPGVLSYDGLLAEQPATAFAYPELSERAPAAMAYSSATTGRPKGVVYSHRALYLHTAMLCMADTWAISEADTVLPVVPMYHVNAWGLPFAGIWMGSRLVLPGARPTADDLLPLLTDVTFAAAVPTVWMDVFDRLEASGTRLPKLRTVVSGGAPLPAALLRRADRLGVPLIHSYGMTEASPVVLVGRVRSDLEATEERRLKQGFVVPGLDHALEPAAGSASDPRGLDRGELRLRGPWIVDGYERDERSAAAFADGWYRTGDVVTRDEHGYLQVVDRMSDLVKSGGEWISTIELEDALTRLPGVTAAAVVGVPDDRWQERPRAYVVCASPFDTATAKDHLATTFPRFWVPDEIVVVDALPLTSVGKYDKKRLRAMASATPSEA